MIFPLLLICFSLILSACTTESVPNTDSETQGKDTDTEKITASSEEVVIAGGENEYTVVYSEKATDDLKAAMKKLTNGIRDITGEKAEFHTDKLENKPEVEREILVGVTNREESASALESVSAPGYSVEFIGEKLVITGSSTGYVEMAIDALMSVWTVGEGSVSVMSSVSLRLDDTQNAIPMLNSDFEFAYRIIGASADKFSATYASNLSIDLQRIAGGTTLFRYDTTAAVSETSYELLIGPTNRPLSAKAYEELGAFDYRIVSEGNKIAIVSHTTDGYERAVNKFKEYVQRSVENTYKGDVYMPALTEITECVDSSYKDFKAMSGGTLTGIFDGGDSYVFYYENTTASAASEYVQGLISDGYTLTETYSLGDNAYSLLMSSKYTVYVSYLPMVNATRVYVEKKGTGTYPTVKEQIEVAEPIATPAIWQLEVDTYSTRANGGMSYVMQLPDESFIVVDGGYDTHNGRTSRDAENLYKLLMENKPASHEKPIIAAWFITHLHGDHFGALMRFAETHANDVTVQGFYFNFPQGTIESEDGTISGGGSTVKSAMKKFAGAKLYNKLHSGMQLGFAGAEISIICTFEDVYPNTFADANDTCTVFRVTLGNQRIMILGDARENQSAVMETTIPRSELECGMVQVAHHGYEGCNPKLYQLINAHTALWPMNIVSFQPSYGRICNVFAMWFSSGGRLPANRYLYNAEHIKKIFVSGQGTVKLELPYTPTGDRIIDYNKYYTDNWEAYKKEYFGDSQLTW